MTKSRAGMVATCALSVLGLAVDRLLLGSGPQAASAQVGTEGHGTAGALPEGPARVGAAPSGAASGGSAARDLAAIRDRLEALNLSAEGPRDALILPAAWAQSLQAAPPAQAEQPAPPPAAVTLPKLGAVLRGTDGGRARLDDRFLRVGEAINGLTVTAIGDRSVTLRDGLGRDHTVSLPK